MPSSRVSLVPIMVLGLIAVLGCGDPPPPRATPGGPTAQPAPVAPGDAGADRAEGAAAVDPPPEIAWQWDGRPDLFPLVDLVVEHAGARYVLAAAPSKRRWQEVSRELRREDGGGTVIWSVTVGRGDELGGAQMAVDDERVYIASYRRNASGCELSAYATADGRTLWSVSLEGIGPIAHSRYRKRAQLRLIDGNPVVFGAEAERYIELRDAATGAQLSNRTLDAQYIPDPVGVPLFVELDHMLATQRSYDVLVGAFLARHNLMQDAGKDERGDAFREAVEHLQGLPIQRGEYRLDLQLIEAPGKTDLEIRARRLPAR
jgi:hypothetical protein